MHLCLNNLEQQQRNLAAMAWRNMSKICSLRQAASPVGGLTNSSALMAKAKAAAKASVAA
jgi:hypothetical protein